MSAHIRVTIDGKTLMDTNPGQWTTQPPDLAALGIQPGRQPNQPWMLTVMAVISKAAAEALAGTKQRTTDSKWTMTVETTNGYTDITVTTT